MRRLLLEFKVVLLAATTAVDSHPRCRRRCSFVRIDNVVTHRVQDVSFQAYLSFLSVHVKLGSPVYPFTLFLFVFPY